MVKKHLKTSLFTYACYSFNFRFQLLFFYKLIIIFLWGIVNDNLDLFFCFLFKHRMLLYQVSQIIFAKSLNRSTYLWLSFSLKLPFCVRPWRGNKKVFPCWFRRVLGCCGYSYCESRIIVNFHAGWVSLRQNEISRVQGSWNVITIMILRIHSFNFSPVLYHLVLA